MGIRLRGFRAALCLALGFASGAACREKVAAPAAAALRPTARPTAVPTARALLGYLDESSLGPARKGGTLRRRLVGDPSTLNAVLQSGAPEQEVLQYLSRNLLDFDSRMRLVPGLAESWSVSPDGLAYTFTIRPDAVWEDGSPVTAADAVFTIRRIVDPAVPSPVFKPVFDRLASVEASDTRTFVARFREPYAYHAMAFVLPLLPERRFAARKFLSAPDNRAPLSNGPYRLSSWHSQREIVLERNPRAWGFPARFDRVVFRILPDDSVAYRALVAGDLDQTRLDASLRERAGTDAAFQACCRAVEFYGLGWNYIALDNRSPLFSDARVRRALTMLLDRGSIVRELFKGSARIISGPWAPDSPAYDASVAPLPYDPAAAAALLDEAGWKDTNGNGTRDRAGREFTFELLVSSGTTIGRQIDETFAAALAKVGIAARVRPMEWAAFSERVDAGDFEAASLAWSASDPNPDPYPYWHSSQVPPAGLNSEFYRNAEADRLMEEARRERDEPRRLAIYHRLHRIFRDEAPVIFVATSSDKFGFAKRVRGLVTSPLGFAGIWPGPAGWWEGPPAVSQP
ncbi:MAG TPA: ABC transporter substrate-binding protein [Thermoanaerobaculia bacterium]|nr:ABC transporter substrate-binding protein [Thermoanaerobaculia bacterium]